MYIVDKIDYVVCRGFWQVVRTYILWYKKKKGVNVGHSRHENFVSGSILCRHDRAVSAKSADIWLSGRHVADMLATLPAKTKEWMILSCFTCNKCIAETCEGKRCIVEGCDKFHQAGSKGNCLAHATQAHQRDAINDKRKRKKRCVVEGCDKLPVTGCKGHCLAHATQAQRDAINDKRRKKEKRCAVEGCDKFPLMGCKGHCLAHK